MVDMTTTIAPKSDQLNADDLIGGPRTITVTRVTGNEGNAEQPVNVFFEGDDGKPFRPCKSMRRVMVKIWGADASKYVGKSMTIFRDPKVKWGGMEVGGIRISHMTGLEKPETMALTETRSARKPYTVQPLKVEEAGDPAKDWADKFIAKLGHAPDLEKLNAFIEKNKPHLTTLESDRPELHKLCDDAVTAARKNFTAGGGDAFAGTPAETTTNFGGFVEGITARIDAAETAEALNEICEDIGKVDLPDDEIAALDVAIAKKRRVLAKAA